MRIPALAETGIRKLYNGPESFTPDNQFLLGRGAEPARLLRRRRLQLRGHRVRRRRRPGARRVGRRGRADQRPGRRRHPPVRRLRTTTTRWLRDRVVEILGLHYAVPWPNRELESGRPLRRSPLHDRLAARNACFGSRMGWERANVFAPAGRRAAARLLLGQAELAALVGRGAARHPLRRSPCSTRRRSPSTSSSAATPRRRCSGCAPTTSPVPVGTVVYTGLLNRRGTYESDLTVTRVADDEFLLVSSSATTDARPGLDPPQRPRRPRHPGRRRDLVLRRARGDGPALARAARPGRPDADLDDFALRARRGWSGSAARRCAPPGSPTSASSAGSSTCRPSSPPGVYDDLMARRRRPRAWSTRATTRSSRCGWRRATAPSAASSPRTTRRVEAGLLFACKLDDRRRLPRPGRARGGPGAPVPAARLVSFVVDDPEPMLWGGELVLRDGVPVGQVTSAAWGETVGALRRAGLRRRPGRRRRRGTGSLGGSYAVDVGGSVHPVTGRPAGAVRPGRRAGSRLTDESRWRSGSYGRDTTHPTKEHAMATNLNPYLGFRDEARERDGLLPLGVRRAS